MNIVRLVIAAGLSLFALGVCRVAAWIADVPFDDDPTLSALRELRTIVGELPPVAIGIGPSVELIPRVGVLGAIGQAITDLER